MRKTEITRWVEKTPLPGCSSASHIDRCCVSCQSGEHLLGPEIASASIEPCNLADTADSVHVCYDSSQAYSNTTSDEKTTREAISTSSHAVFAQEFLDLTCQERINYPGSGGSIGPHDLSPNTVEEAKAVARRIESARGE